MKAASAITSSSPSLAPAEAPHATRPQPRRTLARARELLSPRARIGLAALPAEQQATTASAVASGAYRHRMLLSALDLWVTLESRIVATPSDVARMAEDARVAAEAAAAKPARRKRAA